MPHFHWITCVMWLWISSTKQAKLDITTKGWYKMLIWYGLPSVVDNGTQLCRMTCILTVLEKSTYYIEVGTDCKGESGSAFVNRVCILNLQGTHFQLLLKVENSTGLPAILVVMNHQTSADFKPWHVLKGVLLCIYAQSTRKRGAFWYCIYCSLFPLWSHRLGQLESC